LPTRRPINSCQLSAVHLGRRRGTLSLTGTRRTMPPSRPPTRAKDTSQYNAVTRVIDSEPSASPPLSALITSFPAERDDLYWTFAAACPGWILIGFGLKLPLVALRSIVRSKSAVLDLPSLSASRTVNSALLPCLTSAGPVTIILSTTLR